jgi:hypothetical protein
MVKELELMSINRLIELFISSSKSWQLTRTSHLNSESRTISPNI